MGKGRAAQQLELGAPASGQVVANDVSAVPAPRVWRTIAAFWTRNFVGIPAGKAQKEVVRMEEVMHTAQVVLEDYAQRPVRVHNYGRAWDTPEFVCDYSLSVLVTKVADAWELRDMQRYLETTHSHEIGVSKLKVEFPKINRTLWVYEGPEREPVHLASLLRWDWGAVATTASFAMLREVEEPLRYWIGSLRGAGLMHGWELANCIKRAGHAHRMHDANGLLIALEAAGWIEKGERRWSGDPHEHTPGGVGHKDDAPIRFQWLPGRRLP